MKNKELLREYNNQFIYFVNTVDMGIEMLMSRKEMVIAETKVKYDKEYDMTATLYLDEGDIMISLKSDYPYVEYLEELFQFYIDTTYHIYEEDNPQSIGNTPEDFFNELVRRFNVDGENKFAIGCNDKDMPFLTAIADYVDKQDGWNAHFEEDILYIEKL